LSLADRTNQPKAIPNNTRVLANRTYTVANVMINETQRDTVIIPDTLVTADHEANDSSWQRDIDRLMKKLEEPTVLIRSQTEVEETQIEEDLSQSTHPTQQEKISKKILLPIATEEIAIQTETNAIPISLHSCCQDVSSCPCVLVSFNYKSFFD
jgi:hypothetical protein